MAQSATSRPAAFKEQIMRFAPAAAALSLFLVTTASVTTAQDPDADPRAAALIMEGRALLSAGDTQAAIDAFEAALAVDPAYTPIFLELAAAARQDGLQGKAIRFYREALIRDPDNFAAISGEGEALVEKGALEKAKRNLARLESLCGANCPETVSLQGVIDAGPPARLAAETPQDGPTSN
ncbi:tetratricopeptide repeat protein [Erythrobacter sp. WH131]|uniref:Tetratricopeptide repeat protein n=2 Tax=Erythrobacter ani TaxID=2827235 RepID=A0ABS6SPF6_9SPHN|nr:tetratricopeptide repeat protein [Erythrobacter ani]